ncbi:MAG: A/G-specific adenine glycosylase [Mariprofundaceae bacterium]|nr:A/G-specific adenine glycosylase [Mariprofundaceae bacterium]
MSFAQCNNLLEWYRREARALPWRKTADPYRIWISEIMLQQTQVKTVLPRYSDWFEKFPDIATLASASMDELLKSWEGLGYYRRARFAHQTARKIVSEHGGSFPEHFDTIMALPGIGRSTAGAIASFSFGQPKPVLDGNVKRVLKRWHGRPEMTDRELWKRAQQLIDNSGSPADWNQAVMELGATVCSSRSPDCIHCPVSQHCNTAFRPVNSDAVKKVAVKHVHWQVALHTCPTRGIWLTRRPDSGIWASLWTPPITELESPPEEQPCHIHALTHRKLHLYGTLPNASPAGDGRWFSDLDGIALPTGIKRLLDKHGVRHG